MYQQQQRTANSNGGMAWRQRVVADMARYGVANENNGANGANHQYLFVWRSNNGAIKQQQRNSEGWHMVASMAAQQHGAWRTRNSIKA